MSLNDVMNPNLECVSGEILVSEAAEMMLKRAFGALVVGSREKMEGIFTERDVLYKVVAVGKDPKKTKVKDIMSSPVEEISISVDPNDALRKMDERGFRHLPVIDVQGKAIGMLSIRDLFHYIVVKQAEENEALLQFLSADGPGG